MSASAAPSRVRVRTPGKHIVLSAAVALAVAGAGYQAMKTPPRLGPAPNGAAVAPAPEEFLVDLAPDRSGRIAYLKLVAVITPEKNDVAAAARIAAERAAIRERISFLLRGLSPEDFAGAEGAARVKAEMRRRVDLVIAPEKTGDVVITDLVIQ